MKPFIFFLLLCLPFCCIAQNRLTYQYFYDESGNRIKRKVLYFNSLQEASALDSTDAYPTNAEPYYVESLSQIEIKIYPNPATEKITMEISNMENIKTGNFQLYTLNGQMLKECPVHSATTVIPLLGLPAGVYILKVNMNGKHEDWKIIKQ